MLLAFATISAVIAFYLILDIILHDMSVVDESELP